MTEKNSRDHECGAIKGAFIRNALAFGPNWHYNLDKLRHDYGEWIKDYTDSMPNRYHCCLKAGQLSQAGFILTLMVRSLIDRDSSDAGISAVARMKCFFHF